MALQREELQKRLPPELRAIIAIGGASASQIDVQFLATMVEANNLYRIALRYKLIYALSGVLLGLSCILAGVGLALGGAAGHTHWTASMLGLEWQVSDLGPGIVVLATGVFVVLITRFKMKNVIRKETDGYTVIFQMRRDLPLPPPDIV